MKSFFAVALVVALVALPACAQRGGSRGGFSGHSASGSRGGFAASAPSRVSGYSSGYRGFTGSRSPGIAPHFQGYQRGTAGYPNARPAYGARSAYGGGSHRRRPYVPGYRGGAGYIAPGYGWVGPYLPSYSDDPGYDDSSAAPSQAYDGSDALPPYPEQPAAIAPYQPTSDAARPTALSEEAVTLIFKDGRPPEQIHNYVLTRTTLFVGDQQRRAIPTDQLDLAATANVNREAGVDFQLPEAPN